MENSPILRNSIVEQVMEQIKFLIVSGKYKVGDKLPPENELAECFGVSRSSIREAVKIFNYLGVLKSNAGKGTYLCNRSNISASSLALIAFLGGDETSDIIEMRMSLELWCALRLSQRYQKQEPDAVKTVQALSNITNRMYDATNPDELAGLDFSFHETVIEYSGNPLFISVYKSLRAFSQKTIHSAHQNYPQPKEIASYHDDLLRCIAEKDPSAICAGMQKHLSLTNEMLKRGYNTMTLLK